MAPAGNKAIIVNLSYSSTTSVVVPPKLIHAMKERESDGICRAPRVDWPEYSHCQGSFSHPERRRDLHLGILVYICGNHVYQYSVL